jgi:hypothetical protein
MRNLLLMLFVCTGFICGCNATTSPVAGDEESNSLLRGGGDADGVALVAVYTGGAWHSAESVDLSALADDARVVITGDDLSAWPDGPIDYPGLILDRAKDVREVTWGEFKDHWRRNG